MKSFIIPSKFKLHKGSYVYQLLETITPIFNSINYFPEYTLHNNEHINSVLKLASELITDNTLKKLESQHIEYLVSAILIHDIGMFIQPDGLHQLIFGIHKNSVIPFLSEKSWNDEWNDFYYKAKRYDDKKLIEIFGNNSLIPQNLEHSVPFENETRQRLLYGDFLRKNHHRLAYDIAHFGFPGHTKNIDIFGASTVDETTRNIVGLIAYSHGINLRDTDDYIINNQQEIEDFCPIYYLMSIMRLADYLDIGKHRASQIKRDLQKFSSPISDREFDLNQSITFNKFNDERKQYSINGTP